MATLKVQRNLHNKMPTNQGNSLADLVAAIEAGKSEREVRMIASLVVGPAGDIAKRMVRDYENNGRTCARCDFNTQWHEQRLPR